MMNCYEIGYTMYLKPGTFTGYSNERTTLVNVLAPDAEKAILKAKSIINIENVQYSIINEAKILVHFVQEPK